MSEICMTPFDGNYFFDLKMSKEMDIQIYNASLALYQGEHPTDSTGSAEVISEVN